MEIWGGIECTINRVENNYYDQLDFSGHYYRNDLPAVCDTGIQKIRYPILWEKHRPEKDNAIDWSFTDRQLSILRERNVEIIAGLVHHGSGPSYTNLTDENFPQLLAEYAAKVAARYPYIQYYTPINEPLTTARFSGLYGLWYPHKRDDASFVKMLLIQLKGVVLSMQEIRKINPGAKLIQTEDLGKTYSTPQLQYQAVFENRRRWLTFDILCGKLDEFHPMWKYFTRNGIKKKALTFFLENPCVPDVFGFNYYATSERYLDHRVRRYSDLRTSGNGLHKYADVEAIRVELDEPHGLSVLLSEAWKRFRQPIAMTEVHLHCHREEQQRWFNHILEQCNEAIKKGVDVKAVTAWAMLGSWGWSKLLTEGKVNYEPGIFDLRNGEVRPTAMFSFFKNLTADNSYNHPWAQGEGWWQRRQRLLYGRNKKSAAPECITGSSVLLVGFDGDTTDFMIKVLEGRNNKGIAFLSGNSNDIDAETAEQLIKENIICTVIYNRDNVKIFSSWGDFNEENVSVITRLCEAKTIQQVCISASPATGLKMVSADDVLCLLAPSIHALQSTNFMHAALDLIIDDEKGSWKYNSKTKFFKKEAPAPELLMVETSAEVIEIEQAENPAAEEQINEMEIVYA